MNAITEATTYFKEHIPTHLKYPSIEQYIFTEKDQFEIQKYINTLGKYIDPPTDLYYKCLMVDFIGDLVRDRVNKLRPSGTLPITEWWD
jgi:hypothetical protein